MRSEGDADERRATGGHTGNHGAGACLRVLGRNGGIRLTTREAQSAFF